MAFDTVPDMIQLVVTVGTSGEQASSQVLFDTDQKADVATRDTAEQPEMVDNSQAPEEDIERGAEQPGLAGALVVVHHPACVACP